MKLKRLTALTLCLGSMLTLSGCQKASNITKICMPKTVDGMNLYLTANAKGKVSNTYIYLNDKANMTEYAQEVYDKANNGRPNCDVAYFPVYDSEKSLKHLFELDKETKYFKVVYIDNYEFDAEGNPSKITGVWVGRDNTNKNKSWVNSSNNTGRKFIDGIAKAANYRASLMKDKNGKELTKMNSDYTIFTEKFADQSFKTFSDMYDFMSQHEKELPEYIFSDDKNESRINYKSVYEYCAIFALQNRGLGQPFNSEKDLNTFKTTSKRDDFNPFINNEKSINLFGQLSDLSKASEKDKEITEEGKALLTTLKNYIGIDDTRIDDLKLMRHGIAHVNDPASSGSMKNVILYSCIGGGVILLIIVLLIIRRVKTGKKLFDVRRALDADIDPEDPRIINMKKVAADLKKLREDHKIHLEKAAKDMHIPVRYLKNDIEAGEIVLSKRNRKKYIEYYKLPADYFDKAYKINDEK